MTEAEKAFEVWFKEYGCDEHQYEIARDAFIAGWEEASC